MLFRPPTHFSEVFSVLAPGIMKAEQQMNKGNFLRAQLALL